MRKRIKRIWRKESKKRENVKRPAGYICRCAIKFFTAFLSIARQRRKKIFVVCSASCTRPSRRKKCQIKAVAIAAKAAVLETCRLNRIDSIPFLRYVPNDPSFTLIVYVHETERKRGERWEINRKRQKNHTCVLDSTLSALNENRR